jgi:Family of unknown function (DUF5825)
VKEPLRRLPVYRLPRAPGSGRVVAPPLPFSDTAAVLEGVRAIADAVTWPAPQSLTLSCSPGRLPALAGRLASTGVGDLRVIVRLDAEPGAAVTPRVVAQLASATVAGLEIGPELSPAEAELADWFELGKACLSHGVPLLWRGSLAPAVLDHWAHLPPARNQPEWQHRWRYGQLGWRRGPGFAAVTDSRGDDIRHRRIRLTSLTPLFGDGLDQPASAIPHGTREALVNAGLAAVFAGRTVWLPYRLRRWPPDTLLL